MRPENFDISLLVQAVERLLDLVDSSYEDYAEDNQGDLHADVDRVRQVEQPPQDSVLSNRYSFHNRECDSPQDCQRDVECNAEPEGLGLGLRDCRSAVVLVVHWHVNGNFAVVKRQDPVRNPKTSVSAYLKGLEYGDPGNLCLGLCLPVGRSHRENGSDQEEIGKTTRQK